MEVKTMKESHKELEHKNRSMLGGLIARLSQWFSASRFVAYVATALFLLLCARMAMASSIMVQSNTISAVESLYLNVINNRQLVSTSAYGSSASVCATGGTFTTIQDCVNAWAYFNLHKLTCQVCDGTYDEDVLIPPTISVLATLIRNESTPLNIHGNSSNYDAVKVKSFYVSASSGSAPHLAYMTITGNSSYDNENAGVSVYGSPNYVSLTSMRFNSTAGEKHNGVVAYGSEVLLNDVNFTSLTGYGIAVKKTGKVREEGTGTHGTVGTYGYVTNSGGVIEIRDGVSTLTGGTGIIDSSGGRVYGYNSDKVWGVRTFMESPVNVTGNLTVGENAAIAGTLSAAATTVTTLDTGQGATEVYVMDQDVQTSDAVTFATLDTGQGANELYDMDQNVLTTSDVVFNRVNTGVGLGELYDMNQYVKTTSDVVHNTLNITDQVYAQRQKWDNPASDYLLVGHWTFSESPAQDYSGYGNDGTATGATLTASGKIGAGMAFDGNNDVVNLASAVTLADNTPWSIAYWAKQPFAGNMGVIGKTADTNYMLYHYTSGNNYRFVDSGGNTVQWTNFVQDTNWHHFVVTTAGAGTLSLYIDGVSKGSQSEGAGGTGFIVNGFGDVHTAAVDFNGTLDDIRIYNRTLDLDEVQMLYGLSTEFYAKKVGLTDSSSYWLCTAADCSTKCQVTLIDGLITACT